jgi:putative MATE family efflux protein
LKKHTDLTQGSVVRHLATLTVPMIAGVFAIMAYNLTDTYFVSKLGTDPLAAMGFTFPIVMVVGAIAMGIGMGAASCISRAIGQGDQHRVRRLATDGMILAMVLVATLGALGLLTMGPLFRLLGAEPELLPLIRSYMTLWYSAVGVVIIPMVGNNMIRATGNTLVPSMVMIIGAILNVVLDPLFIFGWGPVPSMGIFGAALATVLSRLLSGSVSIWVLTHHCGLLEWARPKWHELVASWRDMLYVAIPAAATQMLMPLSRAVMVRMVAIYGTPAIAAVGAGSRVERFIYIVCIAMGSCLIPLVGQNWGAGRLDRVRQIRTSSAIFDISYGLLSFLLALVAAAPVARLFSDDPEVTSRIVWYLRAILMGSALHHVGVHTGFMFNAINRPGAAALFSALRMPTIQISFAWIGMTLGGLKGLFLGLGVAPLVTGVVALVWFETILRRTEELQTLPAPELVPEG